jgi:capsular exopolysaccharide synthesis family protein
MNLAFFGLQQKPFSPTPDPRFLYSSPGHRESLAQLLYGVQEHQGFIVLTGEIGTGKTMLLRTLLNRLDGNTASAFVFDTPTEKLVQILLVGQPELLDTLDRPELRQLKQRIGLCGRILPLTAAQTGDYIRTRLQIAGTTDLRLFSEAAITRIAEHSGGIPRLINTLCDHCLLIGYANQIRRIDRKIVEEALERLPQAMSKFFQAREQAEPDRALQQGGAPKSAEPTESPVPEVDAVEAVTAQPPPTDSADGVDDHLVSLVAPATFEAEQYRALRHTIEQFHKMRDLRVVAVSSPGVGDGKTITAINLAGALAQAADARVLLVDADLRRPSVAGLLALGGSDGPGLVNVILDPALTLEHVVRPRPPFNLSVIPAGPAPPSPYEVLKSPRLGKLLEEARRHYDYIVLDVPPLCPVQDCRAIAHWVDGFLLVVAAHHTPRRLVKKALNVVERGKILGFFFNGEDHPPSSFYGYDGYHGGGPHAAPGAPSGHGWGQLSRAVARVGDILQGRRRGRR